MREARPYDNPADGRPVDDQLWCELMLPRVSRTFALCIRFLPTDLQQPVLLSYLLCRIADTIEDTPGLDASRKRALLDCLSEALTTPRTPVPELAEAFAQLDGAEARLAASAGRVLGVFEQLPADLRAVVVPWVQEMCQGMGDFAQQRLQGPAGAGPRGIAENGPVLRTLATETELDRYCYVVAGTVGHLLTGLFGYRRLRGQSDRLSRLDALAESFGSGLQLTNIIVDTGQDQSRGVSYVPDELCLREGLAVEDLLAPATRQKARAVMGRLIGKARSHLEDALQYCELVPRVEYQIRLFCLVPVFLAVRTLRAAESSADFPSHARVKIGRSAVYRTVAAARLCASSNHLVRAYTQLLEYQPW